MANTTSTPDTVSGINLFGWHSRFRSEEIAFAVIITLACVGIAFSSESRHLSHIYWLLLAPFMASVCLWIQWRQHRRELGEVWKKLLITQLLQWGAFVGSVQIVYMLLRDGRLVYETGGLLIALLLGLTIFSIGIYTDWLFLLAGAFLGFTVMVMIWLVDYLWMLLFIGIGVLIVGILINRVVLPFSGK